MKKTLSILCAAAATLVACNKAEVANSTLDNDSRLVRFATTNIYSFETKTDPIAASKTISVFAHDNNNYINVDNNSYTISTMPGENAGTLTGGSIQWGLEQMGTSNASTFFAIYPYANGRVLNLSTNLSWPITTAENVEEAMQVLVAYTTQAPGSDVENPESVSFNFTRPFAELEYTVTNSSDDAINYIEVDGVYVNGSISMSSSLTDKGTSTGTQRLYCSNKNNLGAGTYYGVVYPAEGVTPRVIIHLFSGASATYTVTSTNLQAGYKYSANISYTHLHLGVTSNNSVTGTFTVSTSWTGGSFASTPTGGTPTGEPSEWPFVKGDANSSIGGTTCDWSTGKAMTCVGENLYRAVITKDSGSEMVFKVNYNNAWYGGDTNTNGTEGWSGWQKINNVAGKNITWGDSPATIYFDSSAGIVYVKTGDNWK